MNSRGKIIMKRKKFNAKSMVATQSAIGSMPKIIILRFKLILMLII